MPKKLIAKPQTSWSEVIMPETEGGIRTDYIYEQSNQKIQR